jgi:hypothetical protein
MDSEIIAYPAESGTFFKLRFYDTTKHVRPSRMKEKKETFWKKNYFTLLKYGNVWRIMVLLGSVLFAAPQAPFSEQNGENYERSSQGKTSHQ